MARGRTSSSKASSNVSVNLGVRFQMSHTCILEIRVDTAERQPRDGPVRQQFWKLACPEGREAGAAEQPDPRGDERGAKPGVAASRCLVGIS